MSNNFVKLKFKYKDKNMEQPLGSKFNKLMFLWLQTKRMKINLKTVLVYNKIINKKAEVESLDTMFLFSVWTSFQIHSYFSVF